MINTGDIKLVPVTDLPQFGQRWQHSQRSKTHVDHAEELQLLELICEALNLSITGATVIHHQLRNLQGESSVTWGVYSVAGTCTDNIQTLNEG